MVISMREQILQEANADFEQFRAEAAYTKMKQIVMMNGPLSTPERTLLSESYRETLKLRRDSLRRMLVAQASDLKRSERLGRSVQLDRAINLRQELLSNVKDTLDSHLLGAVDLLENHLMLHVGDDCEGRVLYMKLLADTFHCLAEFAYNEQRVRYGYDAGLMYMAASALAVERLPAYHPLRLSVAINYAVMQYEICHCRDKAIDVASMALADCTPDELQHAGDHMADSLKFLSILDANVKLWLTQAEQELTASGPSN